MSRQPGTHSDILSSRWNRDTHVTPARISSIVFDFVNPERMRRKEIVDAMTMMIRTETVLMMLQTMTGINRRRVIKDNSTALAVR
jgi:hypothetical protein